MSRLVGSPPGYVGFDEGGQLTKAVRERPYSVVLFDEIEKAHPDIFNILLQILEEGRLTDSQGRSVDFRNTVIIMTSNLGSEYLLKGEKDAVVGLLHKTFKPEFLNRIDEIVYFNPLGKEAQKKIVDKMLHELSDRLKEQFISIEFAPSINQYVLNSAYSEEFGARPLKRFIQDKIETFLANKIVEGTLSTEKKYLLDLQGDQLTLVER